MTTTGDTVWLIGRPSDGVVRLAERPGPCELGHGLGWGLSLL